MSVERVKEFLKNFGRHTDVIEVNTSTATVNLAAAALGTIGAKIAKTIALHGDDDNYILILTAGDAKIDNKKFKDVFGVKPRMLSPDETLDVTGFSIGGVCPFALPANKNISLNLDISLKRFRCVYPACGSSNSAIKLTPDELILYLGSPNWVDVCKQWDEALTD